MIKATSVPAVAYYRMSSKKQDKSIPAQRVEVEKFATANGYEIIRWETYVDEGISGSESEKRDGFQRLMRDATEVGDFRAILCWDQDRFSRFDPLEANHYWFLLRQAGVRIVTVRQGELDLSELGGWLVASINQHGKAQYLKDLSANVLRGRLRKAEKGLWAGSRPPYGYVVTKDGHLKLGDHEAVKAVKYIFKSYLERDISLRDVAEELNGQGIPAPGNGDWTGSKVQAILRRETYTGKANQFKESKGKFFTITNRGVAASRTNGKKPRGEWFPVECPAIIDAETWAACEAKLVRRRVRTSPRQTEGLLSGMIYCGHCGARMMASNRPLDSSGELVYCCSTYNARGARGKNGCNRNLIHQGQLVPFLVEKIQELVLGPANLGRLKTEINRQLSAGNEVTTDDGRDLRAKLAKADKDIREAAAELKRTPDDLYDLAVEDLRRVRAGRERIAKALEALETAVARPKADTAKRSAAALQAIQGLGQRLKSADPAVVREALNRIVERIDLWFDHKKTAKLTKSLFRRGVIKFRKPTGLSGLVTQDKQDRTATTCVFSQGDLPRLGFIERRAPARKMAADWLRGVLGEDGLPAAEVRRRAVGRMSLSNLYRGRRDVGVVVAGGRWRIPTLGYISKFVK